MGVSASEQRTSRPGVRRCTQKGLPAPRHVGPAAGTRWEADDRPLPGDTLDWSWPPYAPVETDDEPFDTADWAPASVVWHPLVRVGRWTVVYRRAA